MKQIPNAFTLLNLVFGCLAIIYTLQPGLAISYDENGSALVDLPEEIYLAPLFIAIAAVIDFLDGFVARLLKASSEMGKQLDSLADVVSFGVAPSLIIYQFLRFSYAQQENGIYTSIAFLLPALLIPCAGAYRLARFNIDTSTPSTGFKGVPIPMAGIFLASFPLMYWFPADYWQIQLLSSTWFWYFVIILTSILMVSRLPMLALKFAGGFTVGKLVPFIIIAAIAAVAALFTGWFAVTIAFVAYVIISLMFKPKQK